MPFLFVHSLPEMRGTKSDPSGHLAPKKIRFHTLKDIYKYTTRARVREGERERVGSGGGDKDSKKSSK